MTDPWDATNPPTIEDVRALYADKGATAVHDAHCNGYGEFPVMDGTYRVPFACPKCKAERDREMVARRVRMQVEHSGIGPRYWDVTWDDLDLVDPLPMLKAACDRIGDIIREGHSLILCGKPGTGKTQAAVLLMRAAIEAGRTAALANIGRVGMEIRAGYDQEGGLTEASETKRLEGVDLLVLDDLGVGEAGEAKIEHRLLYFVAEARQNATRPTIITSNLSADELGEFMGPRVKNRLMPVELVTFAGRNFRHGTGSTTLWRAS